MFSSDLHAEDKLIILLALETLDMPITGLYINDLLLEPGYMNYFNIQIALGELLESKMVEKIPDSDGIPMYTITEKGRAAYQEFKHLLPEGLALKYENHILENKDTVKKMLEVNASIFTTGKDSYYVRCFVRDKGTYVIDIKVPAANKQDAADMCKAWKENTAKIYMEILKILHP